MCHSQSQIIQIVESIDVEDEAFLAGDPLQFALVLHANADSDDRHAGIDDQPSLGDSLLGVHVRETVSDKDADVLKWGKDWVAD